MDEDSSALQQLKWATQALAADAEAQLRLFPDFVDKPFELVDDFANWWEATRWRESTGIGAEQSAALDQVQHLIDELPDECYTVESVRSSAQWMDLRTAAREALRAARWSVELPPEGRSCYVASSDAPLKWPLDGAAVGRIFLAAIAMALAGGAAFFVGIWAAFGKAGNWSDDLAGLGVFLLLCGGVANLVAFVGGVRAMIASRSYLWWWPLSLALAVVSVMGGVAALSL